MVRRWVVLVLAVVAVLVVAGAWIGVRRALRDYRSTRGATVDRFTLHSRLTHRDLHEILVVPEGGGRRRELLVFLHGRDRRRARTSGSRFSTSCTRSATGRP